MVCWLLVSVAYRCRAQTLGHTGFSSCGSWAQHLWLMGSRAQVPYLWLTGLVALRHVGSSRTRDWSCVSCIGRQILYNEPHEEFPPPCFNLRQYWYFWRVPDSFLVEHFKMKIYVNVSASLDLTSSLCPEHQADDIDDIPLRWVGQRFMSVWPIFGDCKVDQWINGSSPQYKLVQ